MLAEATVQQVRDYSDIVGIVSDYVTLKRRGRNYVGLCPFHSEKTPSFTVSPEKGIFHCFGCHESGDHISFVSKVDNLSFVESVKHIAMKAGIEVVETERDGSSSDATQKDRTAIQDILFMLREQFEGFLRPETSAYRYLSERGLTDATIRAFNLGVCPSDFNLVGLLLEKGYDRRLIAKTGVVYQSESGQMGSRFRNRAVFPVLDHHGRTLGFGGRILEGRSDVAKYVNSEDSLLFNKRRIVYGLDKAKAAIKSVGHVLLMEGYMDVIMAHQYGFGQAVATMGTALTPDQVRLLKRYTDTVILCMDSDEAGQRAMENSFDVLRQSDIKVQVLALDGKDPADVLVAHGAEHFAALLAAPQSILSFKLSRLLPGNAAVEVEDIVRIIDAVLPILKAEKEAVVRQHYIKVLADRLGIEREIVMAKLRKDSYNIKRRLVISGGQKKSKYIKAEESLIYLMASNLEVRAWGLNEVKSQMFIDTMHRALFEQMGQTDLLNKDLIESFSDDSEQQALTRILIDGEVQTVSETSWKDFVETIKSYTVSQRVEDLKQEIKRLDALGEDSQVTDLMVELQSLIKES